MCGVHRFFLHGTYALHHRLLACFSEPLQPTMLAMNEYDSTYQANLFSSDYR